MLLCRRLDWWRGSYQEFLQTGFHWETVPLLGGAAIVLSWIIGVGITPSTLVAGSVFPAVILARIVLDGLHDPTSHNLWPFEVAVACVIGMILAFPAAGIGWLLRRITHRYRADDGVPEANY